MTRLLVELTYRYFMCLGYLVSIRYPFKVRRLGRGGKAIESTKFIDVIAYNRGELVIARCTTFRNVKKIRRSLEKLIMWFNNAEKYLNEQLAQNALPIDKVTKIRKVLVLDDKEIEEKPEIEKLLGNKVEILKLSSILSELEKCAKCREEIKSGEERGGGDLILSLILSFRHLAKE